jgi:hypothetical protein
MAGTPYQVTVRMSADSVRALASAGYALYAFAPVASSGTATSPLVWLRLEEYAPTTVVAWSAEWEAFTASPGAGTAGRAVVPGFSVPAAPGQMLRVDGAGGTGEAVAGPFPGRVAVLSAVARPYACGLSQRAEEGGYAPVCVLPLRGGAMQLLSVPPAVLLMFSTVSMRAGTFAGVSTGPGVLLDLADETAGTVTFDVDQGWTWAPGAPCRAVPAATDLAGVLVQPVELPDPAPRVTAGERPASAAEAAGGARTMAGTPAARPRAGAPLPAPESLSDQRARSCT